MIEGCECGVLLLTDTESTEEQAGEKELHGQKGVFISAGLTGALASAWRL